jgi:hypothetical protein
MNLGNHELYQSTTVTRDLLASGFVASRNGTYLTSNVDRAGSGQPVGSRFTLLQGTHGSRLLVLGFLYDMKDACDAVDVSPVAKAVRAPWFKDAAAALPSVDAVVVLAHMHIADPLVHTILSAIRSSGPAGASIPVQFLTGHSHIRASLKLDAHASALEAGKYADTIGFASFNFSRARGHGDSLTGSDTSFGGDNAHLYGAEASRRGDDAILSGNDISLRVQDWAAPHHSGAARALSRTPGARSAALGLDGGASTRGVDETRITHVQQSMQAGSISQHAPSTDDASGVSMSSIAASGPSPARFGNDETRFTHVQLPMQVASLARFAGVSEAAFTTAAGRALEDRVSATRRRLGVTNLLGCSEQSYAVDAGLSSHTSAWGLYMRTIAPEHIFSPPRNSSQWFVSSSGALRYGVHTGNLSVDDLYCVLPFVDRLRVARRVNGAALAAALEGLRRSSSQASASRQSARSTLSSSARTPLNAQDSLRAPSAQAGAGRHSAPSISSSPVPVDTPLDIPWGVSPGVRPPASLSLWLPSFVATSDVGTALDPRASYDAIFGDFDAGLVIPAIQAAHRGDAVAIEEYVAVRSDTQAWFAWGRSLPPAC